MPVNSIVSEILSHPVNKTLSPIEPQLQRNVVKCSLLSSPTKDEQGVESIHHYFKRLALSLHCNAVRDPAQKLLLMLKEHMLHVTAENISARRPNVNKKRKSI